MCTKSDPTACRNPEWTTKHIAMFRYRRLTYPTWIAEYQDETKEGMGYMQFLSGPALDSAASLLFRVPSRIPPPMAKQPERPSEALEKRYE